MVGVGHSFGVGRLLVVLDPSMALGVFDWNCNQFRGHTIAKIRLFRVFLFEKSID